MTVERPAGAVAAASAERWWDDDRLARMAWSRVAEPGDRMAAGVREVLGPASSMRLLLESGGPGPLARALRGRDGGEGSDGSDGGGEGDLEGADPEGAQSVSTAQLREAVDRWRVRLRGLDPRVDLTAVQRVGGRVVVPGDEEWPRRLDDLGPAAPACLWVRGPLHLDGAAERSVAVVGARASTAYGEHVAAQLAGGVAAAGWSVVSGGALGIDAAAHRAALAAGGTTVAVLACGVDRAYPASNAGILRAMAEGGLVVSEFPPGTAPTRWRFLERNRLIAAMSAATVVVEAAWRSGALSTATRAAGLGRPLGAVPGPVTSPTSAGCHRLLRDLAAVCVTDAAEVLELAGPVGAQAERTPDQRARPHDDLDGVDGRVWESVPVRAAASPASVARAAGLPLRQVVGALGRLQLRGMLDAVATAEGSAFRRRPADNQPSLEPHPPQRV